MWSNSSESSDDSSSPALAHQRLTASNMLQTTLTSQLSFTPHKSSTSTPSLSSNQEEEETEAGEVFSQAEPVPNGHLRTGGCPAGDASTDCAAAADRVSVQSADLSDASADLSCSCPDVSCVPPGSLTAVQEDAAEDLPLETAQAGAEDDTTKAREGRQGEASKTKGTDQLGDAATVSCCVHRWLTYTAGSQARVCSLSRFLSPLLLASPRRWRRPWRASTSSTVQMRRKRKMRRRKQMSISRRKRIERRKRKQTRTKRRRQRWTRRRRRTTRRKRKRSSTRRRTSMMVQMQRNQMEWRERTSILVGGQFHGFAGLFLRFTFSLLREQLFPDRNSSLLRIICHF